MTIQLHGYEVELERIYAYKAYANMLGGAIDTRRNNKEEDIAKKELQKFSYVKESNFYLPPIRKKKAIDNDDMADYYDENNYREENIESFWVFLELISYDDHLKKDKDDFCTGLNVACNIQDIELNTIKQYLYKNLTIEIWKHTSIDYTP